MMSPPVVCVTTQEGVLKQLSSAWISKLSVDQLNGAAAPGSAAEDSAYA
jgi:hypothetical protein